MSARHRPKVAEPGQDSFLDIVANLVGILIILIMVIGAQATDAMVDATDSSPSSDDQAQVDVKSAKATVSAVESDIHAISAKLKRHDVEIEFRRKERDKYLQYATLAEEALKKKRDELDQSQRDRIAATNQLLAARSELEDLKASEQALRNSMPQQKVIEHLPTPLASTVFGREIHFRLAKGRITYVPWDELVERLKQEAPDKLWKLKDSAKITEVLGPINGFRMQYTLRHARKTASVGSATVAVQTQIKLDRFVLIPVDENLGEPFDVAMRGDSQFRAILDGYDPDRTTVTVWVYPDSFEQFRTLKADLFKRGYLTAGRPMPDGQPIGGSPDGSRSAAQ